MEVASDIFSVGCVIGEIFMDGRILFDLSNLLKYKTDGYTGYDPSILLNKYISDANVRQLIEHCIHLDPKHRWTARKYLDFYDNKIFPSYFNDLYQIFCKFLMPSFADADNKIKYIQKKYIDILNIVSRNWVHSSPSLHSMIANNKKTDINHRQLPINFASIVPEIFRKSPNISSFPNSASASKERESLLAIEQNVSNSYESEHFQRLIDYHEQKSSPKIQSSFAEKKEIQPNLSSKQGGISLALYAYNTKEKAKQPLPGKNNSATKNNSVSFSSSVPVGHGHGHQGFLNAVNAAYKGKDTRLLDETDIADLMERLKIMNNLSNESKESVPPLHLNSSIDHTNSPSINSASIHHRKKPSFASVAYAQLSQTEKQRQLLLKQKLDKQEKDVKRLYYEQFSDQIQNNNDHKSDIIINIDDKRMEFEGLLLVNNVVCASLRNCRKASNRLIALEIISGFGEYLSDQIRLDRLISYIKSVIHDDRKRITEEHAIVVAKAIEVLSITIARVIHVPAKYARIFPDYILETIKQLIDNRREEIVRIEIARQLTSLALTAKYFIEYRDHDRQITLENVEGLSVARKIAAEDLQKMRTKIIRLLDPLFQDSYPTVQRALLSNCIKLCEFLGPKMSTGHLIPLLFTFFNRKEWQLIVAVLDIVVGICLYVGKEALDQILLPCLQECLNDVRPAVVERCLEAFTSLTELRVFDAELLLSRIPHIAPLAVHFSGWVRNACINFLLAAASVLGDVRAHCRMLPCLEAFLTFPIVFVNRQTLTAALKTPLDKNTFDLLLQWRSDTDVSLKIKHYLPDLYADQPLLDAIMEYVRCVKVIKDDDQEYLHLKERKPPKLYSILIEPTVSMLISSNNGQSISNLSPNNSYKQAFTEDESAINSWQDLNRSIRQISSNGMISRAMRTREQRHPRQVDHSKTLKIREALDLPPPPPSYSSSTNGTFYQSAHMNGDKLFQQYFSTCSFYKNHQPPYDSHSVEWCPRGRVITQLTEHEESVNCMRVSRDNLFLATASNDKTVKIWSCHKIKQNASIKAEGTYTHQKSEIISLAILDSSHSIASGARDGTLHIFRVEYSDDSFAGLQNKTPLDSEENSVVAIEHFNTITESLIVFATQAGNIHGWDMRRCKLSFQLPMEPAMGPITAMTIGPTIHTCIVGTARGFVVVWDLRFDFPVQMWHHYDRSPIVSLTVVDAKSITNQALHGYDLHHEEKGPLVFISTERSTELCGFDITSGTCKVRFCMNSARNSMFMDDNNMMYGKSEVITPKNINKAKSIFKLFAVSKRNLNSKQNTPVFMENKNKSAFTQISNVPHLGLKISQLPSVYPSSYGQCPATRPFSLPSFEQSDAKLHQKSLVTKSHSMYSENGQPSI